MKLRNIKDLNKRLELLEQQMNVKNIFPITIEIQGEDEESGDFETVIYSGIGDRKREIENDYFVESLGTLRKSGKTVNVEIDTGEWDGDSD